jgi:two-component sensor histidine kinase
MATPLALALTELIHNALEHGLADVGDRVEVSVRGEGDDVVVEVRDNGRGLRENFDIESDMNLGLQIVKTLTENELSGALTFINGEPGTIAKIRFRRDSGFPSFSRDDEQRDVS